MNLDDELVSLKTSRLDLQEGATNVGSYDDLRSSQTMGLGNDPLGAKALGHDLMSSTHKLVLPS